MLKKIISIIFLCGLMVCTSVGLADEIKLPEKYLSAFSGSEWESYSAWGWSISDVYGFVAMKKDDQNILCWIEPHEDNTWKIRGTNSKILRPGALEMDDPLIHLGIDGLQTLSVNYSTPSDYGDGSKYSGCDGDWPFHWYSNWAEAYGFDRMPDGSWQLDGYGYYDAPSDTQFNMSSRGDLFLLRRIDTRGNITTYVVQTPDLDFQSIDPAILNTFISDSIDRRNEPPEIPSTGLEDALPQPQVISFPKGQSLNVYSGPGTQYTNWRLDTEALSEDIWMQVFGQEGDWLLVQYPVGDDGYDRFCYIPVSALPSGITVPLLHFDSRPGVIKPSEGLTCNPLREITHNPLWDGESIYYADYQEKVYFQDGAAITCLATLGTYWTYIEAVTPDGTPYRGFALTDDIEQ